jgi:hypothetical protein
MCFPRIFFSRRSLTGKELNLYGNRGQVEPKNARKCRLEFCLIFSEADHMQNNLARVSDKE